MIILLRMAILTVALSGLGAASAQAREWVVAPDGTGTACTAAAPCPVLYGAVTAQLQHHDSVVFRPGTYDLGPNSPTLIDEGFVDAGGDGTGPVIIKGEAADNNTLVSAHAGSRVHDLQIINGGPTDRTSNALSINGFTAEPQVLVERVRVETSAFDAILVKHDTLIRDSIAISRSTTGGAGLTVWEDAEEQATVSARNVTALGHGSAVLVDAGAALGMRNSIAHSFGPIGLDLELGTAGKSLAVAYTSYRPSRSSAGVTRVGDVHYTSADPQVDPATGRIAVSSPLRDKGDRSASGLGTSDPFGRPRVLGPAPDVGAHELLPVAAVTAAAPVAVGTDRATLGGTVEPGGVPVQVRLEVAGRTIDLGTTSTGKSFSVAVDGLAAATDYTARLVARHEEGEFPSAPITFRTAAPPPAPQVAALTSARLDKSRFGRRRSTVLRLSLARAARGELAIVRRLAGRRRDRSCVAPTKARRGRRCTRSVTVSRKRTNLAAGTSSLKFAPRSGRRLLPAGSYVLRVVVEGKVVSLPFRLTR